MICRKIRLNRIDLKNPKEPHSLTIVQSFIYTCSLKISKALHKKQSPILDEDEAFKKAADRATVSCALLDLIASQWLIRV